MTVLFRGCGERKHSVFSCQMALFAVTFLLSVSPCLALRGGYVPSQPDSLPQAIPSALYPCPGLPSAIVDGRLARLCEGDMFRTSQLGLCVWDLTSDSLLFSCGADQYLRPASCQKLLTSITVLSSLGESFRLATTLYHGGVVRDTALCGDLYIRAGFDPLFGYDDMQAFAQSLSLRGIKRVDGRVCVDVSLKDTLSWGEGWCWDDGAARLTPLLYHGRDEFMRSFFETLSLAGVACENRYVETVFSPDTLSLLSSRTHTLGQVLRPMMKQSDNLCAEALFYQLGILDGVPYPSSKASARRVEQMVREAGGSKPFRVADGSGLSLYNYTTARILVRALRYAYQRGEVFAQLLESLPQAGVDGTLSSRMKDGAACANVRAKTGTVTGVSSLAGYVTAAGGHTLCFAIINQGVAGSRLAHMFQDTVCQMLAEP